MIVPQFLFQYRPEYLFQNIRISLSQILDVSTALPQSHSPRSLFP